MFFFLKLPSSIPRMMSKLTVCVMTVVYLLALVGIFIHGETRVLGFLVYFPLIFLNGMFAMLLILAGKHLYQKNF